MKSRGTEMNSESSFLSFASLSTGKPWMAFDTVSLFTSLSNSGPIEALVRKLDAGTRSGLESVCSQDTL